MGGKKGRREGVLERGRAEFGDEFVIFSGLTLIYVTTEAVFALNPTLPDVLQEIMQPFGKCMDSLSCR